MENSPLTSLKSANIHVLLAEDNHVNRLLAKTILKRILPNARITEAINGQIAVDAVMKDKPDLVLMDIQMPELNGYEATARIREIYGSKIPILALTAGNVLGEREKCLAAGMDDFLAKPFVEDALRDMLEKWSPVIVTQTSVVDKEHFDEAVLMAFVNMGKPDPALLDQVIEASLMDLRALEADMQIMDGLKEKYKGLGHKIYGIAASLGFKKLARLSREMEDSSGAMDELERLYRAILEELQLCIQTFEHYR